MGNFFVPHGRTGLIRWFKKYYYYRGKEFKGYSSKTTKQLYAMFYGLCGAHTAMANKK